MRKLKKILPITIVLFLLLIPFSSAFAYAGGLLNGNSVYIGTTTQATTYTSVAPTDGNATTGYTLPAFNYMWFSISPAKSIDRYYIDTVTVPGLELWLLGSNDSVIRKITTITDATLTTITNTANVRKVVLYNNTGSGISIREFDVIEAATVKKEISNLNVSNITESTANITWSAPTGYSGVTINGYSVYVDGILDSQPSAAALSKALTNLTANTNHTIKVSVRYSDGTETSGLTKTFTTTDYVNVTNLTSSNTTQTGTNLTWINPISVNFDGVKIYKDNILLTTLDKTISSYDVTNLNQSTTYQFKVTTLYTNGTETSGSTITVQTPQQEPVKKVLNVDVSTTYNRVNLSWNLPQQEGFKHVNIYRIKIEEEPGFFESLFSLSGSKVYAAAEEDKIFETNGTYFNDLTVEPESTYEYTLTTQTTDSRESEGVTVLAETTEEPEPVLKEDGHTVDENGDYVFKWTEPTKGTVKVLIDGQEYKIVEASLKQVTIPKEQMKFDSLGDPKVSLIPISPYGKEGSSTNPGGLIESLKLPFEVNDFLATVMGILGIVAPIILLTLAIYYFKPIKTLIVRAAIRIRKGEVKHE